jgi:hypothetical protein
MSVGYTGDNKLIQKKKKKKKMVAMVWALLGMVEAVLTKCTLPYGAFPFPFPLLCALCFPFFFEPEDVLPEGGTV